LERLVENWVGFEDSTKVNHKETSYDDELWGCIIRSHWLNLGITEETKMVGRF
jgi:hypothetical protein